MNLFFICHEKAYRKKLVSNIDSPDRTIRLKYTAKYCHIIEEK